MTVNHDLMESLEYKGEYERRYLCRDCIFRKDYSADDYTQCEKLPDGVEVSGHNNVCRSFEARIKNPSAPEFNFDDYIEFLGSDYYRPEGIDRHTVVGKVWGPIKSGFDKEGIWSTEYGWKPRYKWYDKPYCRTNFPRCHVKVDGHKFEIDYRLYREQSFVQNGEIIFDEHRWKDKPTQRKYQSEYYGTFKLCGKAVE